MSVVRRDETTRLVPILNDFTIEGENDVLRDTNDIARLFYDSKKCKGESTFEVSCAGFRVREVIRKGPIRSSVTKCRFIPQ